MIQEMSIEEPKVKETMLSRRPQENALLFSLASILVMLVISLLSWRDQAIYAELAASSEGIFLRGEYWRLFSALAVHADMKHLMSNALLFGFFSYLIYGYFGFLVYPLAVVLLGAATNLVSLWSYADPVRLVGVSGVVYLMAGFWLTMYMLIERRYSVKRRLLHGIGVGLVLLMPSALNPSISYRTHFIGLVVGFFLALGFFWLNRETIRGAEVKDTEGIEHFQESWQETPPRIM